MSVLEEDDVPALSAETFLILQQFYKEQNDKEQKFQLAVESETIKNINIEEDWQLSQFWYDDQTIETLVNIALNAIGPTGKVALISCPSLYKSLRQKKGAGQEVTLYEYDKRFAVFGADFQFYDYKFPLELGDNKAKYYDLVIVDPPFLSEECLKKNFISMKYLSKDKIILCTGEKMTQLAEKFNLQKTMFAPKHKNNLANEFCCFANFNIDS